MIFDDLFGRNKNRSNDFSEYQKREAKKTGSVIEISNAFGMKMRLIPSGDYMMGGGDEDDEQPIHRVIITKPFYFGKYPLTQEQFKSVTGIDPSK